MVDCLQIALDLYGKGKRITAFMQAFSAYEDEEAYSHLFEPLIAGPQGQTYSVFEVLSRI